MTSRERLLAAIKNEPVDRVPVGPFGLGHLNPDDPFTWDFIQRTDPFISPGAGGDAIGGGNRRVTTEERTDATVMTLHTPKGPLTRVHQRTNITSAVVEFYCKNHTDVETVLAMPYEPPELDISQYNDWRERVGEEALVIVGVGDGICFPADYLSPEDFCLLWLDAPDLMREMTRVGAERLNDYVTRVCEFGVDGFRIVGGEYASVQLGPEGFAELVVPFDRQMVDIMHRHDAIAYYHNHGPTAQYYAMFAEIGFDALDPLEASPWGDCDLSEAKAAMPDVCLVGNLDDMEVIDKEPLEVVQQIGRERIAQAGTRGFVLGGTASGTYTEQGARGFMALVDVAEEVGA